MPEEEHTKKRRTPVKERTKQQILVGGVGGQGVLFVTSLLAEAAIRKGLPVFTSETHGMAQRGGTVVSHLKVGSFSSPMIRPGHGNVLLALKPESIADHEAFLGPDAWIVVNRPTPGNAIRGRQLFALDADETAKKTGNPKSANLVLLGFALAQAPRTPKGSGRLFCSPGDLKSVLEERLAGREGMLEACIRALEAGHGAG
jgi:indolepyruvate ferredoxin oxidoreductase beta subunit